MTCKLPGSIVYRYLVKLFHVFTRSMTRAGARVKCLTGLRFSAVPNDVRKLGQATCGAPRRDWPQWSIAELGARPKNRKHLTLDGKRCARQDLIFPRPYFLFPNSLAYYHSANLPHFRIDVL